MMAGFPYAVYDISPLVPQVQEFPRQAHIPEFAVPLHVFILKTLIGLHSSALSLLLGAHQYPPP